MRFILWNCAGAFRKKIFLLRNLNPDIVIIPECECPVKFNYYNEDIIPGNYVWYGDNKNKGIGVFSFNKEIKLTLKEELHNKNFKYILPIGVNYYGKDFNLLAVWTKNDPDTDIAYIGQIFRAVEFYQGIFNKDIIIAGDFNASKIWDRPSRKYNFMKMVDFLYGFNIKSQYHLYYNNQFGVEEHPTLYFRWNKEKTYHIDYCFCGENWSNRLSRISISGDTLLSHSDHALMLFDFNKK
jgi:exodeoxyribonuclease-3